MANPDVVRYRLTEAGRPDLAARVGVNRVGDAQVPWADRTVPVDRAEVELVAAAMNESGIVDDPAWVEQLWEAWSAPWPATPWWWLSFVDTSRPKVSPDDDRFLGGCWVPAEVAALAPEVARDAGLNPGGQVATYGPYEAVPPGQSPGRLYTRAEIDAFPDANPATDEGPTDDG